MDDGQNHDTPFGFTLCLFVTKEVGEKADEVANTKTIDFELHFSSVVSHADF